MRNTLILIPISLLFFSCKTVLVKGEYQYKTDQSITLGTVGQDEHFQFEQDYNHLAIPNYNTPIKISAQKVNFNKASFKSYRRAAEQQNKHLGVQFIDSLKTKPNYLKLEFADRIAVMNALNNKDNADVKQYLSNVEQAHVINSIAIAFNSKDIELITKADELFLESIGKQSYTLKLYNKGTLPTSITFNQGVVFAYQTSKCCWKQNDKYKLQIIDIVEENDACPRKSYSSAKRANKTINYFKL